MPCVIKNEKGSLGIAIVVVLIGLLSGTSLSMVAFRDTLSLRYGLDAVQELHFLRAEIGRGRLFASTFENLENPPQLTVLPIRDIQVSYDRNRTVFQAKTKINIIPGESGSGYIIRSLISATRGTGQLATPEQKSPVKRYGENHIQSLKTLAIFHYFSDVDRDASNIPGNIRFYGQDVIHGRVHSNSDIWIRQTGGGTNNDWPTFYGLVSTSGKILVYPGGGTTYPEEDIFRGGLIEEYPKVQFEATAAIVRANGARPFGSVESDEKIAFVTIDGSSWSGFLGTINTYEEEEFPVYNSYPPYGPIGTQIALNTIARVDTVWTPASGTLSNTSAFVPFELWISGEVSGRQTWASSHNVYLKGDLTYANTQVGQPPDGGEDGNFPVNSRDYLGIISEKKVIIQYGYCDPDPTDRTRKRPNTSDINLYGAYCAMGYGPDNNYNEDGIFTFQYQFPKASTPDQMYQGQFYTKIDLYRYRYPTSAQYPWLPQLDYPWYNPIWPEPGPTLAPHPPVPNPHGAPQVVFLRGNIYLWGSVAQRRRGFVRRSGNADFDTDYWEIENYVFGAATGRPSGYDKRYTFDTRFENVGPPDFPLVKFVGYESDELMDLGYETISWVFKKPPTNF